MMHENVPGDRCHHGSPTKRESHGPTSYWMHDPEVIFRKLDLHEGEVFLDIGCGNGDYSLRAARDVGSTGTVYALDIRRELVDSLMEQSDLVHLDTIRGGVYDIRTVLPLDDTSVDVCFISTVLHILNITEYEHVLFPEIRRVLRPGGKLFIIECKKEETRFGPPISMRISQDELEEHLSRYGFSKTGETDLDNNYLISFRVHHDIV